MTARMAIALLSLVGILIALYLTLYKIGVVGDLSCSIGSCETVNTSRWATFLGLPVAAWGLAAYVALFALSMAGTTERYAGSRGTLVAARRRSRAGACCSRRGSRISSCSSSMRSAFGA